MEPILYPEVPLAAAAELSSLRGKYASIGAFNINFYAQGEGVANGLEMAESPGIVQASKGAIKFQGGPLDIYNMFFEVMRDLGCGVPISFNLDHGNEASAIQCIDNKFGAVMIDASDLNEQQNIELTRKIAEYAHKKGVSVEGEYGKLAGVEEHVSHDKTTYADPKFVPVFLDRSKADFLAIAYGTSHGPNKGKTDALRVSIVAESYAALKAHHMNLDKFLVSHGSSTVPGYLIAEINKYGGCLDPAKTKGVPEYKILEAIASGIRKINIDTDLRMVITAVLRKYFMEHPDAYKRSDSLSIVKAVFDGKIKQGNDGKIIENPGLLIDPRDYFWVLKEKMPDILKKNYKESKDEAFIEVNNLISGALAKHVAMLARLFGSAGLADKVDRSMTLERMADEYTIISE